MIFKFEEGERAHKRGQTRAELPYAQDSREGAEWLAGWDASENAANHYADDTIRRDKVTPEWERIAREGGRQ